MKFSTMNMQIPNASICTPYDSPAQLTSPDGCATWLTRGRTFVVAISSVVANCRLDRGDNPDEYMLLVPKGVQATIQAGNDSVTTDGEGDTLTVVPPGASGVTFHNNGYVTRIFSHRAVDLMATAVNAADHPADEADEAPPAPPGGFRLRHYALDQYKKPDSPARPFRSTNMLINAFVPRDFRRDTRKMTPHAHDDFDQASLALQGNFIHHLRYPWATDMSKWRVDGHHAVSSPSLIVIPAQSVHTTQDVGEGWVQLVDIFSPPRPDFVEKPGWVCNEADYPA
ncbi:hypothetical protein [Cupriavidus lacunae]|nr:hypothetical protein [Cupriavidus lacunae]